MGGAGPLKGSSCPQQWAAKEAKLPGSDQVLLVLVCYARDVYIYIYVLSSFMEGSCLGPGTHERKVG